MLKSWSDDDDKREWEDVEERDHIAQIRAAVQKNFPKYFASLVRPAPPKGNDLLSHLSKAGKFKVTPPKKAKVDPIADASMFEAAIRAYEKESVSYRDFFSAEGLQQYRDDDPDAFKTDLSRKCPIIRKLIQSKRSELKEWRIKYNRTPSEELLSTFEQLLSFAEEYLNESGDEEHYVTLDAWDDFEFDGYDEDSAAVPGVIGGGIKSLVLYHREPRVFPSRSGAAMYGLFFLTEKLSFGLRSKTSEFLMIDDHLDGADVNIKMDHNYWYSYRLFTSYAMMVARLIEHACKERSLSFDVDYRHVYVDAFFQHVCDCHADEVKVMRGVDDLKEQYWAAR